MIKEMKVSKCYPDMPRDFWNYRYNPITGFMTSGKNNYYIKKENNETVRK